MWKNADRIFIKSDIDENILQWVGLFPNNAHYLIMVHMGGFIYEMQHWAEIGYNWFDCF